MACERIAISDICKCRMVNLTRVKLHMQFTLHTHIIRLNGDNDRFNHIQFVVEEFFESYRIFFK